MVRIKVRNLELLQKNIIDMVAFALENGYVQFDNGDDPQPLVDNFTNGCSGTLNRSELEDLLETVQQFVRLPVYTSEHAAAWLGVGIDTMRDAIWRSNKIKTIKPGHDVLITHAELVKFRDSRG